MARKKKEGEAPVTPESSPSQTNKEAQTQT